MRHADFLARTLPTALTSMGLLSAVLHAELPQVSWRFELPGQYVPVDPVRSDDGTLYVMDLLGTLHAVDPGGAEIWSLPGVGPQGLDIGPDGTLYAGNDFGMTAVNPDGSVKWTYPLDPIALVSYGPAVGPEGNVYFVGASITPIGQAISLTPAGELRWTTPISMIPTVSFADPVFGLAPDGGNQFVFSGAGIRRIDCDDGVMDSVGGGSGMRVVTNLVGNIYHRGRGYDSAGNSLFSVLEIIEAASLDGTVYAKYGGSIRRLDGEDASVVWSFSDGIGTLDGAPLSPNPDDTRLLYGGNAPDYSSASVRYADTAGSFLWALDLPVDDGRKSHMATRAIFTPDGAKAYFGSTTLFSGPTPNCYLYALELEPAPWTVLPGGVVGTNGVPQLTGSGDLTPGSVTELALTGGPPAGVTNLVLGFAELSLPLLGGMLVPTPDIILFGLPLDGSGDSSLTFSWPPGIPSGSVFVWQHWMADASAPFGLAASHGLRTLVP